MPLGSGGRYLYSYVKTRGCPIKDGWLITLRYYKLTCGRLAQVSDLKCMFFLFKTRF